jgi:hypothetical protein
VDSVLAIRKGLTINEVKGETKPEAVEIAAISEFPKEGWRIDG